LAGEEEEEEEEPPDTWGLIEAKCQYRGEGGKRASVHLSVFPRRLGDRPLLL
jgi:hypothetical protein